MVNRLKRAKQKAKENRIIRNASRLRSAPKNVKGSKRLNKREERLAEYRKRLKGGK